MTSRCPFVTGSKVPGQIAMRLSGAMDSDEGVAVAGLVEQRQIEFEGRAPIALGHYPGTGRQNRSQRCRELLPERARVPIWRIEEHQIVLTSVPTCPFEVRQRILTTNLRVHPDRRHVPPDRRHGGR